MPVEGRIARELPAPFAVGHPSSGGSSRNWRRAEACGCGSLVVWNLGAGRATDPGDWKAMADPIGPDADRHIRRILTECRDRVGIAVAGWGAHGSFMGRDKAANAARPWF